MNNAIGSDAAKSRHASEAEFFDRQAALVDVAPVDPRVLARYSAAHRPWFSKEFRFRLLGDLRRLHILDAGCGDGENAMTFARLGARVTGVDISPAAIDVCRRRARVNDVTGSTTFVCAPLESLSFPDGGFDVVWGDAILHHVLPDLHGVAERLRSFLKPGGQFIFGEPVNLSPTLRHFRLRLSAVPTNATPDERPLEANDLRILGAVLPEMRTRFFRVFTRFDRLFLDDGPLAYEEASAARKAAVNMLAMGDTALLALPGLRRLAGVVVVHGRIAAATPV